MKHYSIDDPVVTDLARFLSNTPLSNGGFAPLPGGWTPYIAQAVLNYSLNLAWDSSSNKYVSIKEFEFLPGGEEVSYEEISTGVHKLTHISSGLYVIDTNLEIAWCEIRKKVANASRSN